MATFGNRPNVDLFNAESLRNICLENIGRKNIEYYSEDYLEHVPLQCLEDLMKNISPVYMERFGNFFEMKCGLKLNDYWFKAVCELQREFSVNYVSLDRSTEFEYQRKSESYKDVYFQLLYNQFIQDVTCGRNHRQGYCDSLYSLMRKVSIEKQFTKYIKKLKINPIQCKYICEDTWLLDNICQRVKQLTLSNVSNKNFEQTRNVLAATVFYGKVKKLIILKCDSYTLLKENCMQLWDICRGEYCGVHPLKQKNLPAPHVLPEDRCELYRHYDIHTVQENKNYKEEEDIYDCVFESNRPCNSSTESNIHAPNFWDCTPIQVHRSDGINELVIGEAVIDSTGLCSQFLPTLQQIFPKWFNLHHLTLRDVYVNGHNHVCDVINDAVTSNKLTHLQVHVHVQDIWKKNLEENTDLVNRESSSSDATPKYSSQKSTLLTHLNIELNAHGIIPTVIYEETADGDVIVNTHNLTSLSTYVPINNITCTNFKVICALIKHSPNLKELSLNFGGWHMMDMMVSITSTVNHTRLDNLTAVTLDSGRLQWEQVFQLVHYNPSLESLSLLHCLLGELAGKDLKELTCEIGQNLNLSYLDFSHNALEGSALKLFLAIIEFRIENHAATFKYGNFSYNNICTENILTLAKGLRELTSSLCSSVVEYLNLTYNTVKQTDIDKLIQEFGTSVLYLDIRSQISGAMAEFVAQM